MDIPSYSKLMWPLMKLLFSQKEALHVSEVCKLLADELKLSEEDRAKMLPSGRQPLLRNRVGWAQDALKRAKLAGSIKWGKWFLTDDGRKFVESHPSGLTIEEEKSLSTLNRSMKIAEILGETPKTEEPVHPLENETPEEILENSLDMIKERVAAELIEEILKASPRFFERLVLNLLHAMGYGTDEKSLNHVGKSGDGGIDGIIFQDKLGLDKVYIQAKRWRNQVGSPEIQTFIGSLSLKGATKGILITTGELSGPAKETIGMTLGKIVGIDGKRLTELMMDYDVGVSNTTLKVPKIDKDYFEE